MSQQKPAFYACEQCKVVIEELNGTKGTFTCCGNELHPLTANTSDGAQEKHLPVIEQHGNEVRVTVGSAMHPMSAEHSIEWACLQTVKGSQRVHFRPDEEPRAAFLIAPGDAPVAVYAYCNLHGLWSVPV